MLAPTRELAQQIEKVMRALGDYLSVKCHACVGGTSVREDTRILQVGAKCRPAGWLAGWLALFGCCAAWLSGLWVLGVGGRRGLRKFCQCCMGSSMRMPAALDACAAGQPNFFRISVPSSPSSPPLRLPPACRVACTWWWAPPGACTTCCAAARCAPTPSRCLCWMRRTRCCPAGSRTRSTTSSSCCPPRSRCVRCGGRGGRGGAGRVGGVR